MPSVQSQLFNTILRNRHLLRFRLRKETWDWNTSISAFREECEEGARKIKLPADIEVSPVHIPDLSQGLAAEWIQPVRKPEHDQQAEAVIFYTHGGGYVSGSCSDHRGFVAKFVQSSGVRALQYEYRLAPEHPFPAALEDSLTAYRWLLSEGVSPTRIIIAGESAGGGLCLSTLLALRDQHIPLPAAAIALSPWTDLTLKGESHQARAKFAIDPPGMAMVCSKYYVGENDPTLPWISPLYGDLHGLPPILILVGNDEMMRDDSIRFFEKAREAGINITLRVGEGMVHCYPLFAPLFPEATQAMEEISTFIKTQLGIETQPLSMLIGSQA